MAARFNIAPATSKQLQGTKEQLKATFSQLATRRDLAAALDVPYWQFDWYVRRSAFRDRYRKFEVPKKSGGARLILAPRAGLLILQRKLLQLLSSAYSPTAAAHAFVADKSVLSNAQNHAGRRWVLNLDLEDFFTSITFPRVRGALLAKPFQCSNDVATAIAQLCCTPAAYPLPAADGAVSVRVPGHLPQGAPTSPLLSNIVCAGLDGKLIQFARGKKVRYTRYADDLSFSGNHMRPPRQFYDFEQGQVGTELAKLITASGFSLNANKTRLALRSSRQVVTGVVVNRVPNVTREYHRKIRLALRTWENHGESVSEKIYRSIFKLEPGTSFRHSLSSRIGYLSWVKGPTHTVSRGLVDRYNAAVGRPLTASLATKRSKHDIIGSALWVLEGSSDTDSGLKLYNGTGFMVGENLVLTCAHVWHSSLEAFVCERPGERRPVSLEFKCDHRDLALLRVDLGSVFRGKLSLAAKFELVPGAECMAAGMPNYRVGDQPSFIPVVVSSIRNTSGIKRATVDKVLFGGMSGGPVLDKDGLVVGVVTHGASGLGEGAVTEMNAFAPLAEIAAFFADANTNGVVLGN